MGKIIVNGEVIDEKDPRAVAYRRKQQGGNGGGGHGSSNSGGNSFGTSPRFGARISRVGDNESSDNGNGQAHRAWGGGQSTSGQSSRGMETRGSGQSGNAAASQNPFKQLASMLGIDGKQVSMPALMGVPATSVDLIYVALVAAAALIFKSWKIPIGALLGYYIFQHQSHNPPQGDQSGRAS
jgi:hypothetical protein